MSNDAAAAPAAAAPAAAASLEASASMTKKKHHCIGDDIACLDDLSDVAVAPFGISARQIVKMTEVKKESFLRQEKKRERGIERKKRRNKTYKRFNGGLDFSPT